MYSKGALPTVGRDVRREARIVNRSGQEPLSKAIRDKLRSEEGR